MAGRIVKMVSFNPAAAETDQQPATQTQDAEALLSEIEAMLDDRRYRSKTEILTNVFNWVSERGFSTAGQRELIDNIRTRVEGR